MLWTLLLLANRGSASIGGFKQEFSIDSQDLRFAMFCITSLTRSSIRQRHTFLAAVCK